MTHISAKRQISGAVNLLLLHPTAFRLSGNLEASRVVVWVWLLCLSIPLVLNWPELQINPEDSVDL